jgi:hypothetical protein
MLPLGITSELHSHAHSGLYMRFRVAEKDLAALDGEPQDETHASVLG